MARGQTGLILLITVLILIATAAFLLVKHTPGTTLPPSLQAFKTAFDACAATSLRQAVSETAAHGGMPSLAELDRLKALGLLDEAREAALREKFLYDDRTGTFLPYYTTISMPCEGECVKSYAPRLHGMYREGEGYAEDDTSLEARLARRVNILVMRCLDDFAREHPDYTITPSVRTRVRLSDSRITADVTFTGHAEREGKSVTNLKTRVKEDTLLVRLYKDAIRLSMLEQTLAPIAQGVYTLILLESGVTTPFPPVYATEMSYTPRVWTQQSVEAALAERLPLWLSLVRLPETTRPDSSLPFAARILTFPLTDEHGQPLGRKERLSVSLIGTPSVSFREGRVIMPVETRAAGENLISQIVNSLVPLKVYQAHYRIILPLSITLTRDGEAFRFAWRTGVWDGKPVTLDQPVSMDTSVPPSAYCQLEGSQAVITLKTPDGASARGTLRYACGDQACSYPVEDGMQLSLPPCVNAQVMIIPEKGLDAGYAYENVTITSQPGTRLMITPTVQALRERTLRIHLYPLLKNVDEADALDGILQQDLTPADASYQPHDDEEVKLFLFLTRPDIPHVIVKTFTPDDFNRLEEGLPLHLYDGSYDLSIMLIANYTAHGEGVRIPEQHGCGGIDILGWCPIGSYTIPEMVLNSSVLAAYDAMLILPPEAEDVTIGLPVFDPALIPEDERRMSDLNILNRMDELLISYPSLGVSLV